MPWWCSKVMLRRGVQCCMLITSILGTLVFFIGYAVVTKRTWVRTECRVLLRYPSLPPTSPSGTREECPVGSTLCSCDVAFILPNGEESFAGRMSECTNREGTNFSCFYTDSGRVIDMATYERQNEFRKISLPCGIASVVLFVGCAALCVWEVLIPQWRPQSTQAPPSSSTLAEVSPVEGVVVIGTVVQPASDLHADTSIIMAAIPGVVLR